MPSSNRSSEDQENVEDMKFYLERMFHESVCNPSRNPSSGSSAVQPKHCTFVAAEHKQNESPADVDKLLRWMTCQGTEPLLPPVSRPAYQPSDESKEPLNKYMLLTPITAQPFVNRVGINGILYSPRSVTPRQKRNSKVRWRDHQVSIEESMCMNTMCAGRSALENVVDDSAKMKKFPSNQYQGQSNPRHGGSVILSHLLSPSMKGLSMPQVNFFSNPLSPPPSPSKIAIQYDPILAFREGKLAIKDRRRSIRDEKGLFNDQGYKVATSRKSKMAHKLIRTPSPYPHRIVRDGTLPDSQCLEVREQPEAPIETAITVSKTIEFSPCQKAIIPNSKIVSAAAVSTMFVSPKFAEIVWRSKPTTTIETPNSRKSAKATKIFAMMNATKKKPVLETQERTEEFILNSEEIPTIASYDESTVNGEDWMRKSRYSHDDGNSAVI